MRISDTEVQKIRSKTSASIVEEIVAIGETRVREEDQALVDKIREEVISMSDRDEMIAELKARIEAGTYNPSAEEIVDGMVRRSIADRIR
jgi:anti-sigma28 factor (negative regulator of flagellin synthesis)